MPSPARSSLSQGDYLCTNTEEGDILNAKALEGAPDDEVVILEAPTPVTSEEESQPTASFGTGLELIIVATLEASPLILLAEGVSSEPIALPSEPLAIMPQELAAIVEVPLLVSVDSSFSTSLTSIRKASLIRNLLQSSLQGVKECSLPNLAVEISLVKDCAATLRLFHYDKETFEKFEGLLKDLEQWGIKAL
ncbi:hypothetical protein AMTR_s00006p00181630 [Amborella trichopoda]|uniref:Uncharacterized protein n=1 Tax=Amborella trichopoda TaxID=13333 RepID=W1PCL5_AMBTC|nr:hypothetical protein AMTR_s00006p00181630 [Amborella trichopoda]